MFDVFLSSLFDPLEGLSMFNCSKLELGGRSQLPTLKGGERGVPVWLPALLLPITWAANVQMAYARPFWTFKLQDLSNDIKNTPMRGVLTPVIELWVFGSSKGLQLPTFGSVSFIFTLIPKWDCDSVIPNSTLDDEIGGYSNVELIELAINIEVKAS